MAPTAAGPSCKSRPSTPKARSCQHRAPSARTKPFHRIRRFGKLPLFLRAVTRQEAYASSRRAPTHAPDAPVTRFSASSRRTHHLLLGGAVGRWNATLSRYRIERFDELVGYAFGSDRGLEDLVKRQLIFANVSRTDLLQRLQCAARASSAAPRPSRRHRDTLRHK